MRDPGVSLRASSVIVLGPLAGLGQRLRFRRPLVVVDGLVDDYRASRLFGGQARVHVGLREGLVLRTHAHTDAAT